MPKKKVSKKIKRKATKAKTKIKKSVKQNISKAKTNIKKVKTNVREKNSQKSIGEITHFYDHISVAVVKLNDELSGGDKIKIEGHGKSFTQKVNSMQMEHEQIKTAKKGQEIGLKVNESVKRKDLIYKA